MNLRIIIILIIIVFLQIINCKNNNINKNDVRNHINNIFSLGLTNLFEYYDPTYPNRPILSEYDFIIVGGGPAGCVLANRLSENQNWTILLIEAGGTENIANQIPLSTAYLQSTEANWGYKSIRQNNSCFGMRNNECDMPRGRILGGTSSINYMIYNRGNSDDFNRWSELGNPGWSYNEILPYFKKIERANLHGLEYSEYHGRAGLLSVEDVPHRTEMVNAFVKAGIETGLPNIDYNGESQIGISYVQGTTLRGQRDSAARSYLYPVRNRKNLHIKIFSRVTKILIDPWTNTAYGVEFINKKQKFSIIARNEVILSSGSFNSPQLLMLSGIGPAWHLQSLQIPIIKDLPVGQTMFDHMSHIGPTVIVNTTGESFYVRDMALKDVFDLFNGYGKLTSIGGVEALAFIKTPNSPNPLNYPDIELIFTQGSFASDEGTGIKEGINLRDDIYNKVYKPIQQLHLDHFTIFVMLFQPLSFGTIELHDTNPLRWPKIDPKYFDNKEDIETLLYGIKAAIKIIQSPAMQKLGARLHDVPVPGCEHIHFGTDNYWRCSIQVLSATLHHQVATCKMGPETDPTTVVNHELKVHGVHRLRVVDTSIIPFPITGHTNADSFMIGEKAADMIKDLWS